MSEMTDEQARAYALSWAQRATPAQPANMICIHSRHFHDACEHCGRDVWPRPATLPGAVPENFYSCTDQANANRLQKMYHGQLISIAEDFYTWDGKRWRLDDGLAQRFACDLSRICSHEVIDLKAQQRALNASASDGVGEALFKIGEEIKALTAWAVKCENLSTQNAALGMLRKLLDVPVEHVDANPWLLNCENGTIDLRTGELRAHYPPDLITRLAPVAYDRRAKAPRFKQFLGEIFQHDAEVADFVQRWYGYAATGDAREQKILIKHGPGGNGKSTLGEAIDAVLGEYSTPATLGLLTGKAGASDTAHLAEIADLRGRRLVTASESEDGAKLKEALLKQLTGGDALKGKRLYGQLFSFKPTHKLELLTNHKPVIKGSDFSIWRRIMLLNFPVKFGSAAEVAAGEAMAERDTTLAAALRFEASGILAWIVEGARLWLAQGLAPPRSVLDANAEYRQQQDHVAEFLAERCTLDPKARQPLPPLYQSYKAWCHDAGRDYPLTRQRLVDELERRVPGFVRPDMTRRTKQGTYVIGLLLAVISDIAAAFGIVPKPPEKPPK
jgi:putative DNA primase/helicase